MRNLAQTLYIISIVSFSLSGVFLILSIVFGIKFGVIGIIGDLTGKTAKKSIEKMRIYNENSGEKNYKSSTVNINRGKITDTMSDLKKTDKIARQAVKNMPETVILENFGETEYIGSETETQLLETEGNVSEETVLLDTGQKPRMNILEEIIFIHTNEII